MSNGLAAAPNHLDLINSSSEQGASLVEYVLLIALVALMGFASLGELGLKTGETLDKVKNRMDEAGQDACTNGPDGPNCGPNNGPG